MTHFLPGMPSRTLCPDVGILGTVLLIKPSSTSTVSPSVESSFTFLPDFWFLQEERLDKSPDPPATAVAETIPLVKNALRDLVTMTLA